MKAVFLSENNDQIKRVYTKSQILKLEEEFNEKLLMLTRGDLEEKKEETKDVEYIFSTWGMEMLNEEEITEFFPNLKCVFYGAGSVQHFARPFINKGIKVFSSWCANGIPVAEYTVAQIILANKGFFQLQRLAKQGKRDEAREVNKNYNGNYGEKIGIIGAGVIGKEVINLLKAYKLEVLVFDPFLSDENAEKLGVKKCGLEEIFETCSVVSNHLANNEHTVNMLNFNLFSKMRKYSTFINTGRGAQVVENDLVKVLEERKDIVALLDVTYPEPPVEGHKFYELENVILTPHIAGSSGDEVHRMAEYMIDEYLRYKNNEETKYEVTLKMLETMA